MAHCVTSGTFIVDINSFLTDPSCEFTPVMLILEMNLTIGGLSGYSGPQTTLIV